MFTLLDLCLSSDVSSDGTPLGCVHFSVRTSQLFPPPGVLPSNVSLRDLYLSSVGTSQGAPFDCFRFLICSSLVAPSLAVRRLIVYASRSVPLERCHVSRSALRLFRVFDLYLASVVTYWGALRLLTLLDFHLSIVYDSRLAPSECSRFAIGFAFATVNMNRFAFLDCEHLQICTLRWLRPSIRVLVRVPD